MKFYKIKLPYDIGAKKHVYPRNYDNLIGVHNIGHIYYDDKADGKFTLLIIIPDDKALATVPENTEEISEREAIRIAAEYEPRTEQITDEAKIRRIELKVRMGKTLTRDEQDAIDIDHPTSGFNLSKNLEDKIRENKQKGS